VPAAGTNAAMAASVISSRRSLRRCRWRAAPTAPRVRLHLDELAGLVELAAQALVLLAQGNDFAVAGVGTRPARRLGQLLKGAAVALVAPLGDVGGVEALAAQERPALGSCELVVGRQHLGLVAGRELPPAGFGWDLGVRVVVHAQAFSAASMEWGMLSVAIVGSAFPRPLAQ
jgi:hypothetical protein